VPLVGDADALWAHVPMNETQRRAVEVRQRVGVFESFEHLHDHAQMHPERHRRSEPVCASHDALQKLAVHVLHDEKPPGAVASDLDRLHQVRVIQSRRDARLVEKRRHGGLVVEQLVAELSNGQHPVVEIGGDCQVDEARVASSELDEEPVLAYPLASVEAPCSPTLGRRRITRAHVGQGRRGVHVRNDPAGSWRNCHPIVEVVENDPRRRGGVGGNETGAIATRCRVVGVLGCAGDRARECAQSSPRPSFWSRSPSRVARARRPATAPSA